MARSRSNKSQSRKSSQQSMTQTNNNNNQEQPTKTEQTLFWPVQRQRIHDDDAILEESNDDNDDDNEFDDEFSTVLDAIVKIHCTHSEPDYLIPWQKQHQSTSTSSGFIISIGNNNELCIMTNAHSVEYGSIVQVQKRGQEHKYEAIVEHIANECDLAILKIVVQDDDEDFFFCSNNTKLTPLTFSTSLPELQEEVDVLGYPTGGDSLSVTTGVVSRIEMQEYTQANTNLLAMQVDAAINPGNSGGPVVNDRFEVIGVAFQGLDQAQNIGYVVPVTVVQHLLHDIQRHGKYTGFCSLGASFVLLQNKAFRKSLGMMMKKMEIKSTATTSTDDDTKPSTTTSLSGVMVKQVAPTSSSNGILFPSDVILQVDGIPVANDGKIPFRPGERAALSCYIQTKFKGDPVKLQVLRDGQHILEREVTCNVLKRLVPPHFDNQPPPYLIVAGLVFTVLSIPYLSASGAWEDYESDQISYLLGKTHEPFETGHEFVILSQVLAHRENLGYDKLGDLHLETVNGHKVRSLAHLKKMIMENDDDHPFLRFEFQPDSKIIVLERSKVESATKEVCHEQSIQHSYYIPSLDE